MHGMGVTKRIYKIVLGSFKACHDPNGAQDGLVRCLAILKTCSGKKSLNKETRLESWEEVQKLHLHFHPSVNLFTLRTRRAVKQNAP